MRCSSCETDLDRYIEGTLAPRRMAAISAHLRTCDTCNALLDELRVVDALLATTDCTELAPNFTFAVMAEVRTMPRPQSRSLSVWAILSFYLLVAWIAATAVAVASHGNVPLLGTAVAQTQAAAGDAFAALAGAAHGVGPAAPLAIGIVIAILTLDLVLAATLVVFYRTVRPRLAARLARSEAS